jgi:glycosyltransferase involved in cell wall biosynthesis
MTTYVDVSAAVHSRAGLGRYAGTIAQSLAKLHPGEISLFFNRDSTIHPLPELEHLPQRSVAAGYKPWRMAVWLGQLLGVGFNRLMPDATLYHATEHLLPPLEGVPSVLTVHDLIYRLYPEHHKRLNYWYLNAAMPLYVRRADAVITISEASKRDLIRTYGVSPDKVTVIYEAAHARFQPTSSNEQAHVKRAYGLPERYLLQVGTIEPRKNLVRLLHAFEELRKRGNDIGLVIVGSKGWLFDDLLAEIERSPAKEMVIMPGYVSDDDLPAVYGGSSAAVLASVYEGFGLPILEGMACGAPVVSSRASSLPELGGDAARYFDPYDLSEMTEVIGEVLNDRALADEMSVRGIQQAAGFSWDRAAQETWAVYQRAKAVHQR